LLVLDYLRANEKQFEVLKVSAQFARLVWKETRRSRMSSRGHRIGSRYVLLLLLLVSHVF
jgi:hypothetical protein